MTETTNATPKNSLTKEQLELQHQIIEGAKILAVVFAFALSLLKFSTFGVKGFVAVGILLVVIYKWDDLMQLVASIKKYVTG